MKKLILSAGLLLFVIGCSSTSASDSKTAEQTKQEALAKLEAKIEASRFQASELGVHYLKKDPSRYNYQYVLADKTTGVQYLVVTTSIIDGRAGITMTPLLDATGKPIVKIDQ